ncbi:kinesin-like protein Kip3p [[Candida] railenensis]|uniref:Kinesin-like protein n=1 Tax=[Candida] railenensis TaxID=45579 RepID=A0A9P0QRM9_9ASCO|nr:kinesin-like protein Kip3p [[Candida] railenensis]
MSKESSISVAVRVRPFTTDEERNLVVQVQDQLFQGDGSLNDGNGNTTGIKYHMPNGIRKVVSVVDDKMLIFDPPETNPLNKMRERAFPNGSGSISSNNGNTGSPNGRVREHRFVFDQLFDTETDQYHVYEKTTKPLLDSILEGYNSTVFAYGATGCGKTHTIAGSPDQPGIIMLTMKELFSRIDEISETKQIDVNLSYLEIYNETIRDLLSPETSFKKLLIREDSASKISISNLSTHKPTSVEHVMELIMFGNQNRTCSPTEANATSSRSHAVLQINVLQKSQRMIDLQESQTFATLSIIDLAGSERAAATKNRGVRLHEGANINRSLLALGNCINALCDPRRHNHIPYRDSKLTRLLKFSLGGNCKTVMIVCISPSSHHYDETLNTLKYANRAKEIKTKLIRNQHNLDRHVGSYLKMITEQREEIEIMRAREKTLKESIQKKEREVCANCMKLTLEYIDSLNKSLSSHTADKWKKYHLLAKRKILLLQKVEADRLLKRETREKFEDEGYDEVETERNEAHFLLTQVINKCSMQITELENQYSTPNDNLDLIFNESVAHSLKRLQEVESWCDYNTLIFQQLVTSIRDTLEKDILFNSSVLFDYLVHNLPMIIEDGYRREKLESLLNGEFDSLIEEHTSNFMRQKLNIRIAESRPKRDSRSRSPLKLSPPPKRQLGSFTAPPTLLPSSTTTSSKKVRWEENSDTSIDDHNSTMIMDDSIQPGSELDLSFNPTIESPPITKNRSQFNTGSILSELKQQPNIARPPTHIPIKSFISQQENGNDNKKGPLLNKEGAKSSKLAEDTPFKLKMASLGAPSRLINNSFPIGETLTTSNSTSSGSDKID